MSFRRNDSRRAVAAASGGGGVVPLAPTSIDAANLTVWWDPGAGFAGGGSLGSGVYTTWTSADGSSKVLTAIAGPTSTTNLNGHFAVTLNGSSQYFFEFDHVPADFFGASSWTCIYVEQDGGSPADSGFDFLNAAIFGSLTDGLIAIGVTATQVYAGQDSSGTAYDKLAVTGGALNIVVVQYDAVAGNIKQAVNGGAFDAGTACGAIGASANNMAFGKSGVIAAYVKGDCGDFAVWKSKLTTDEIASAVAYFQAKYA